MPAQLKAINGSFFDDPPSIWRGDPSPEVDAAWDEISWQNLFAISTEELVKLGKDPASSVRLPASWGYGKEAHLAKLDVTHQIHCLNAIRKGLFADYYAANIKKDHLYWGHLKHCLHITLQNILCTASTEIITHQWVEMVGQPSPDFSLNKKCGDYKTVQVWAEQNAIPDAESRWKEMQPTEETLILPISETFWWYNGEKPPPGRGKNLTGL